MNQLGRQVGLNFIYDDTYEQGLAIASYHHEEDEYGNSRMTYGITVKNVRGRGDYVLGLCGAVGDLALENIEAAPGTKLIRDQR